MSSQPGIERSRRALLADVARAGAAGTVVSLTGAAEPASATTAATADDDAATLASLLEVEGAVAIAYRQVLQSHRLTARTAALFRRLYGHELAHARSLRGQLRRLGGSAAAVPHDIASAQQVLGAHRVTQPLGALGSELDCLKLLQQAEQAAVGAYFAAMSKLRADDLLTLGAQSMASEAQHLALIGELLYPKDISQALPDPFVQGNP